MAQLSRSAYVRNLVHSPFIGPTAKGAQGRFDPFAVPSATGPYLREADGWSRRKVDLADRGLGRGKWGGERAYRGFLERDRSARQSRRSGASPKCCLPRERKSNLQPPMEKGGFAHTEAAARRKRCASFGRRGPPQK